MTYWKTLLLCTLGFSKLVSGQEYEGEEMPSETSYESELKKVYQKYTESYITSPRWKKMLKSVGGETYQIKKNDTLWEVSKTLFGDGFYWPKIWSYNPKISNPHQIEVGDSIRFDYGDYESPPSVRLVRGADVEIPPSKTKYVPVVKQMPRSLPENVAVKSYGELSFSANMKLMSNLKPVVFVSSFYSSEFPDEMGEVTELLPDRSRAGYLDTLYLKMSRGSIGDVLTIVDREAVSIESYDPTRDRDVEGVVVKVLAEVRLIDIVNEEENIFRAKVTTSLGPVRIESIVVAGRVPRAHLKKRGRDVKVRAKVVGGRGHYGRKVMGLGETVFLNVGKGAGIEIGDVVTIMANEIERKDSTDIELAHRRLGQAKIVKMDGAVSTAIIIESRSEIASGDVTL